MGPGNKNSLHRGGIADPPMFSPNKENCSWHTDIANWVDLVKVGAPVEGEDKLYKTVYKTLGFQLYTRALPQAQRSIFDHDQEVGRIHKKEDHVAAVQQIVDLIAIYSPIFVVSRLIESRKKVSNYYRKKKESLTNFVSRLSGLISEHLMHADTSPSSKIEEVLTNANFWDSTKQGAKNQLFNAAKARDPVTTDPKISTPKCTLSFLDCTDFRHFDGGLGTTIERRDTVLSAIGDEDNLEKAKESIQNAKDTFTSAKLLLNEVVQKISYLALEATASSAEINIKAKRLPIYLDDTIAFINSIDQGSSSRNSLSALDVEAIFERSLLAARSKDVLSSALSHEIERKIKSLGIILAVPSSEPTTQEFLNVCAGTAWSPDTPEAT